MSLPKRLLSKKGNTRKKIYVICGYVFEGEEVHSSRGGRLVFRGKRETSERSEKQEKRVAYSVQKEKELRGRRRRSPHNQFASFSKRGGCFSLHLTSKEKKLLSEKNQKGEAAAYRL